MSGGRHFLGIQKEVPVYLTLTTCKYLNKLGNVTLRPLSAPFSLQPKNRIRAKNGLEPLLLQFRYPSLLLWVLETVSDRSQ